MTKDKNKQHDPHAKRESKKYKNPIPSREYILEILDNADGLLTRSQIANILGVVDEEALEALRRRLFAMERDGQIYSDHNKAYAQVNKLDLIHGRIQAHKDGFGFLIPQDEGDDVYLPYRQMRKVFDGDEALVRLTPSSVRGRRDGKIVEVVARNTQQLVGRYYSERGACFVRPDNPRLTHDIMIPQESSAGAKNDQFVMVEITQYPQRQAPAVGNVVEVLGDHMAPGMEIDVAIRAHSLPHTFPPEVKEQAARLSPTVDEADKTHRVDMRALPFVTIDGEDARDFDDAVYCTPKKSGGWRLYVAIADVSHYVPVGSPLDLEAEVRSTSVYFPDFVLPMLPEALSNGLCSLNPDVDRLAMVCEMTVSAAGRVSGYRFYEGIIHSHARLTYTKVAKMLGSSDEGSALREEYQHVAGDVDHLYELYHALRRVRESRGAIDFETTETRILFDDQRKIDRIIPVVRNDAHKLIEECMLCANVCAATFLEKHNIDGLFRVHEGPKEQKLENLRLFLGELGLSLSLGSGSPQPADYQRLVSQIADRPDAKVIQTVMLRSLSQAMYQPENNGHFGLAYNAYTHFTSPIRRYPDLLTHRAIRHVIRSNTETKHVLRVETADNLAKKTIYPYQLEDMVRLGEQTSIAERRADDATRDVVSWLKCEFLQDHIGDEYQGVITAVTSFGVFVELLDVYVEGLVHITALPSDFYQFEAAHHRLVGERTRQIFSLGDELSVQVAAVNLDDRKVDFAMVGVPQTNKKRQGTRKNSTKTKASKTRSGKKVRKPASQSLSERDAPGKDQKEGVAVDSVREKLRRGDFADLEPASPSSKRRPASKVGAKPKKKATKKATTKKGASKANAAKTGAVKKSTVKKNQPKKTSSDDVASPSGQRTVRKRKAKK